MGNNEKLNEFFKKAPDPATRAKIDIFKKYFGIYFKLIDQIKKNPRLHATNKPIKYIDLFSGPGCFLTDSGLDPSTPLYVLENVAFRGYSNVSFYFNDISSEAIDILKSIINEKYSNQFDCFFSSKDARDVDLNSIIRPNDITISLIDSFSYLCLEPKCINKLTENYYSDVVCYFRVANILEHIGNENEKNNHIELLGSEAKYVTLLRMKADSNLKQIDRVDYLLKSWIDNINSYGPQKFVLPIFINFAGEYSKIESVVLIISKNPLGPTRVLSLLKDVDNFEGRLYSYTGASIERNSLIDFNCDMIKSYIARYGKWINREQLIDYINTDFMTKYGYISAYQEKIINEKLRILEQSNEIEILDEHLNRKRTKGSYPKEIYFKIK